MSVLLPGVPLKTPWSWASMTGMTVPDWRTSTAGARVRVALWLHTEVRLQGTFTKSQLREAFPSIEQIDRRMRDLRPEGWVISTYREDRSLGVDELRLVEEGGPVWLRGYRSRATAAITDKERQAVFASDDYACAYCGITGGESFADDQLRTAKLTVARVAPVDGRGTQLQTVCDRCHVAVRDGSSGREDLLAEADALNETQRRRLRGWIAAGARRQSPEELLWARYRRSPGAERLALEKHLTGGD